MTSTDLAPFIVRRLDMPPEAMPAIRKLSEKIIESCQVVRAPGHAIILGGSLARGEAIFRERNGTWQLASDIDLLMVHDSTLPAVSSAEFVKHSIHDLPTLTMMTLSAQEFRRLGTNIGYSFKNEGIPLNAKTLPPHSPVELTSRDAFEILLHSVICSFEESFIDRWASGDSNPGFQDEVSRVCTKALRATAMLDGHQSSRAAQAAGFGVGPLMRREVDWQDGRSMPLDPGRIWEIFRLATARFDGDYRAERLDAVSGTRYAGSLSGQIVERHQRLASLLLREILRQVHEPHPDPNVIRKARDAAWTTVVSQGQVRPHKTLEEYFARQADLFRAQLLAMKIEPALDNEA
jgi:hypothetical protein